MTSNREIYTRLHGEPPLPTTAPDPVEPPSARHGALLGLAIAVAVLSGIALIVAGIAWGGPWRWAAAVVTVAFVALIVVPGFAKDKQDTGIEEMK